MNVIETLGRMTTTRTSHFGRRGNLLDRIVRGALAGAIGGVIGAGMKLLGELVFPPRAPGEPIPPAVAVSRLVESLSGSPLLKDKETLAIQSFHWTFSIGVAAMYAALVEVFPKAKIGHGVVFGLVLCLLTHESLLPALGLSLPFNQIPLKEHLSELSTHALFGFCVELVRRQVRGRVFDAIPEGAA